MANIKDVAQGLMILSKYVDIKDHCQVAAEHDVIYAGPSKDEVSKEDLEALDKMGWKPDEEFDCFYHFT